MNKKFNLGFLSVFAVVLSIVFGGSISAKTENSSQLLSTTIVISQAYGGGGGTTGTYIFDYVELKNISSSPQSLNGLSLAYGSATGQFASSATNIFALPNVTLNPGQYYLVQASTAGTGGVNLPVTPDATTTNLSMSGTNGKLALVTSAFTVNSCGGTATPCTLPNANIIDLVSWGTANNAEGGAPTNGGASLTSTQGNVRKTNGCTETDNNNNDFEIVTNPVPRNTATAAAPCGPVVVSQQHVLDFDGNGKTDFAVVRNTGGGAGGQITWFINNSGAGSAAYAWGIESDFFVPEDFDGDNKTDIAVWRSGAPTVAAFYILQSATNTVRIDTFGQTGDDPTVVGDYDGDGKADVAVYRGGASAGQQSTWFFRGSLNNPGNNITYIPFGQNGDFVAPGDYDGDGKNDYVVQRNAGGGQAAFWMLTATGSISVRIHGTPTDVVVPGDYDGDGKTDIATLRGSAGSINWYYQSSANGFATRSGTWGASATDFPAQGDYDGDGKTDFAVWRPSATAGQSAFYVFGSTSGSIISAWGANGDYPVANFNAH